MAKPELVSIRTCHGWDLAQIYKAKLEAIGIPVLLKYESAGLVFGITVDGLGAVEILVPEGHAADARVLLEDLGETLSGESKASPNGLTDSPG